jgi:hypothetical protein
MVLLCALFVTLVSMAPHNDGEMRGFTPCTYQMLDDLGKDGKPDFKTLLKGVSAGYGCYLSVIGQGVKLYVEGKQQTPWANYLFQPVAPDLDDTEVEAFSQDLLEANLLDKDSEETDEGAYFGDVQESKDEK